MRKPRAALRHPRTANFYLLVALVIAIAIIVLQSKNMRDYGESTDGLLKAMSRGQELAWAENDILNAAINDHPPIILTTP